MRTYNDIFEAYVRPSTAKAAAWYDLRNLAREHGCKPVITARNSHFFTVEWWDGETHHRFTRDYHYIDGKRAPYYWYYPSENINVRASA